MLEKKCKIEPVRQHDQNASLTENSQVEGGGIQLWQRLLVAKIYPFSLPLLVTEPDFIWYGNAFRKDYFAPTSLEVTCDHRIRFWSMKCLWKH